MAKEKFVLKLRKANAYSYSLTIPKDFIEKYGWRERQRLVAEDKGRGKIEIRDARS